jgi:GTP pyrophosphokinase
MVSWGEAKDTYPVPVQVKAYDRDGLMRDVSTLIAEEGINMGKVAVDINNNLAIFDMVLEVRDLAQLSKILDRLENLANVLEAHRVRPG